jgi:hypothetical protein
MTQTYSRIQTAGRDANELLDPANWISRHWSEQDDMARPGVSVCASIEDLAHYLAVCGIPYGIGEWSIVELRGDRRYDATPCDLHAGELLVNPTKIVAVTPMGDDMYELIGAAYDALDA